MNTWSGIYKTSFLRKWNIHHNETPGASFQDNGFWFQTFCRAERAYFFNKPYYFNRRDNPNSSVTDINKIFIICDEYKFIENFLLKITDKYSDLYKIFLLKRYHNYCFRLNFADDTIKLKFLEKFATDYK